MYAVDVTCSNGHKFEAWFKNREAFEHQCENNLIECSHCGSSDITQALSPVRTMKTSESATYDPKPQIKSQLMELKKFVEKNFEDVGSKFADEALKIHLGDSEQRGIRGTATKDEEKELADEGVPFFKLPEIQ